jgi:tRNA (mo5U34)-methyltransferase
MWGIIPAAGKGSRIQPLAFSKELLLLNAGFQDGKRWPRAVSDYLMERLVIGGATRLCCVISASKSDILAYDGGAAYGVPLCYCVQPEPLGLCDAIFRALPLIGPNQPVLVGLPDTVWFPADGLCALPEIESPAGQEQWSPEQIQQRVTELGTWFQNMNLGGVQTAPNHLLGDYPTCKWQMFEHAIPERLDGRSVLDIGCNAGFYSIEMKRRGADRVVGIDSDPAYLAQARFAAEIVGADVEFRELDVYRIQQLHEKFDVVLFMGVLYHLRHPLLALDLLWEHAVGDTLVFQSLMRGSREILPLNADYPFWETGIFENPAYPAMFFVERQYSGDQTNWWIPNRACAEAMLRSAGFEITDHPEDEVYICKRRNSRG